MAAGAAQAIQQLRQLQDALVSLQASRYTSAAAATIYVFDILLTFDEEVIYFWRKFRFTFPNILYIINRYVGLGFFIGPTRDYSGFHGAFTDEYCRRFTGLFGFCLAHLAWTGIMTIRVSALWQTHPRFIRLIWCLWVCTMAVIIALAIVTYFKLIEHMSYNPYVRSCVPASNPKIMMMTPIAPTVYELFLTVLTLIKTYKILSNMPGCETPSLLRVLARDGVAYFVVGALISLGNLVSWHFLPSSLMSLFLYLYWSLLSSCIARLVLNLRRTYYTSSSLMTEMDNNNNNVVSANITMTNADMGLGLGSRLSQTKTKEERGKKSSRAKTNSSRHELSTRTRRFFLGDGDLGAVDAGGADASATTTLATNGAGGSGYANNQEEEEEEEAENGRRDGDEDDDDVELGRSILHHDSVPLQTLAFGRRRASGEQERIRLPPSTTGYRTNLASLDAIGDIK